MWNARGPSRSEPSRAKRQTISVSVEPVITPLAGILPVLQIPFTPGSPVDVVDESALRRQVDFCIAGAVHGLVVPALASEFMVLTDEERRLVVEVTIDQAAARVPVVVNVAGTSTNAALTFTRHARDAGATAVMALPPYIRHPTMDGVFTYYAAIAKEAEMPVIVQNAPPPFGISLPTPVVLRLIEEIPLVTYIKEERLPPGRNIGEVVANAPTELRGVFGGTAGIYFPSELQRGVIGSMPSAAVCDVLVTVFNAWSAGDAARARAIHSQLLPLLSLEMSALMAVSKEVLRRRGVFATTTMRDPEFYPLDAGDLAELDALWPQVSALFTV
jgi:dihydrodipicolinate synthase/N-acetylneuraminate lyase